MGCGPRGFGGRSPRRTGRVSLLLRDHELMMSPDEILRVARHEGGLSRRGFLALAASLAAIPTAVRRAEARATVRPSFSEDPFTLGVASGDPTSDGVVLWTRLA